MKRDGNGKMKKNKNRALFIELRKEKRFIVNNKEKLLATISVLCNGDNTKENETLMKGEVLTKDGSAEKAMRLMGIEGTPLTIASDDYPDEFKKVKPLPLVVWAVGDRSLLKRSTVAITGAGEEPQLSALSKVLDYPLYKTDRGVLTNLAEAGSFGKIVLQEGFKRKYNDVEAGMILFCTRPIKETILSFGLKELPEHTLWLSLLPEESPLETDKEAKMTKSLTVTMMMNLVKRIIVIPSINPRNFVEGMCYEVSKQLDLPKTEFIPAAIEDDDQFTNMMIAGGRPIWKTIGPIANPMMKEEP